MEGYKIKHELVEEFKKMAGANSLDPYSFACLRASLAIMESLDHNETVKEAHDKMYGMDLTGFMAGCASDIVSKFHVRGEEYRLYWNERFGVTEEQAKGGVVNPAIVSIKQ